MSLKSHLRLSSLALPALALWLAGCGDGNTDVRHYRVTKSPTAATRAAPAPAATPNPVPAGPSPAAAASGLSWQAPADWKAAPPSSMRLASFAVPVEGGAADLSIVRLSGDAGGFVANINRWRGQIGLAAADEASIRAAASEGKSPLGPFTAVKLDNPESGSGMLAAVFALDGATLFVKVSASSAAIVDLERPFLDFCATLAEARQ